MGRRHMTESEQNARQIEKELDAERAKLYGSTTDDQDPDVRQELDHMEGVDRCVFCGEVIPEGRHVCPRCMAGELEAIRDV